MGVSGDKKLLVVLLWVVWIVGLIWFLVDESMKKDAFVKYHLKQWLVAVIAMVAYSIVYSILTAVTFGLFFFVGWIVYLLGLVWFIQGIVYALQGEQKPLWLVGGYAKHLNF